MKITKTQLRTIIKEEYNALLNESSKFTTYTDKPGEPGDFGSGRGSSSGPVTKTRVLRAGYFVDQVRTPFLDALKNFNPQLRNKLGFEIMSHSTSNVSSETADKLIAFTNDPTKDNLKTALEALSIYGEIK